ncbi:LysR family transcriptional regulator [Agromyces sp. MMS24-K17]|uniref:LysR family transcriptional regulator n=1 Tax=Agromyces sp. MMS24-K17 TaxID=3372850 RepID=UPI00375431FD
METRQLEYFLAVADELSFTRAAERLYAVQSSVSAGIRTLEAELGARLFDRDRRTVALTASGEALLPRARAAVEAIDEVRAAVAAGPRAITGTVRLGVFTNLGYIDLPGVLARFRDRYPGIELRLVPSPAGSTGLAEEVRRGRLDAAFTGLPEADHAGLAYTLLRTTPLVAVLPAGHPLAGREGDRVPLARLAELPMVGSPAGFGNRVAVDRVLADAGLRPGAGTEVADLRDIPPFVAAGFGVGIIPLDMFEPAEGAVARPLDVDAPWPLGLITRPRPAPAAAALARELASALRQG